MNYFKTKTLAIILITISAIACEKPKDQSLTDPIENLTFDKFLDKYLSSQNPQYVDFIRLKENERDEMIANIYSEFSGTQIKSINDMPMYPENIIETTISKEGIKLPELEVLDTESIQAIHNYFPQLGLSKAENYSDHIKLFYRRLIDYLAIKNHAIENKNNDPFNIRAGLFLDDDFYELCDEEQDYILSHPHLAFALRDAKRDTDEYMLDLFDNDTQNSVSINQTDDISANAIKHAMWNYLISQYIGNKDGLFCCSRPYGRQIAKELTDIHEECAMGYPNDQSEMDFHNNQIGRDLHELNSTLTETQLKNKLLELRNLAELVPQSIPKIQAVNSERMVYLKSIFVDPSAGLQATGTCPSDSTDPDCPPGTSLYSNNSDYADQYLFGDWDGDGSDDLAIRRSNVISKETNGDQQIDQIQTYGFPLGLGFNFYLSGDFNGDGIDDIATRDGNYIRSDTDRNGTTDFSFYFGNGLAEDQYLVGDLNGDGTDDIAVRRGNEILSDTDRNGYVDFQFWFGNGNSEDQYLLGDLNGDGKDDIIVRRGNQFLSDTDQNGYVDHQFSFGYGNREFEYVIGDWNGDGIDEIGIRRDFRIISDTNKNGFVDFEEALGNGTASGT